MQARAVQGIIFDMDGTMFDTERIFMRGYEAAGEAFQLPNAVILTELTMGCSAEREKAIIEEYYGIPGIGQKVFDYVRVFHARELREKPVPVLPGLYELLDYIRAKGIPAGVASGSPRKDVLHHLQQTNTEQYFQTIVASDMVQTSKPDPGIFLTCSEQLGVEPANCMVLEDSLQGIKAAHRAGMIPVMVPNLVQPDEETASMLYAKLSNLAEAIPVIEGLLK